MDLAETTHLHKVYARLNYRHNVSLQKQLDVYDKQKRLLQRELRQITKVREAIQQINQNLPKHSSSSIKRDGKVNRLTKTSKYDSCDGEETKDTKKDKLNSENAPVCVRIEDGEISHQSLMQEQRKNDSEINGMIK